jgi:hypothetical protein
MKRAYYSRLLVLICTLAAFVFLYGDKKADTHNFEETSGTFAADSIRIFASNEPIESIFPNQKGNLKAYRIVIDTIWVGLDSDEPVELCKVVIVKNDTMVLRELHPSDLGAESFNPVKWLNEDDLLLTDVGAYDVAGFLLYRVQEDTLYNIDYTVGYELLISDVKLGKKIKFINEGNTIIDFHIE